MAIQFQCSWCGQPIEVDDEAANLQASCPYCNNIVRVPASGEGAATGAPAFTGGAVAMQTAVPSSRPSVATPHAGAAGAEPRPATLGKMALFMMVLAIALYFAASTVMGNIITAKLGPLNGPPDTKKMMEAMMEIFQTKPWLPIMSFLSFILGMTSIGLSIGSFFRREQPRWPAIVVVSLSAIGFVILAMGVAVMFAG